MGDAEDSATAANRQADQAEAEAAEARDSERVAKSTADAADTEVTSAQQQEQDKAQALRDAQARRPRSRSEIRQAAREHRKAQAALIAARTDATAAHTTLTEMENARKAAEKAAAAAAATRDQARTEAEHAKKLAELRKELAGQREALKEVSGLASSVNGINFFTDLNWQWHVKGPVALQILGTRKIVIQGWERKIVAATGHALFVGPKTEFVWGSKTSHIVPLEYKMVIGCAYTNVTGMKKDVTGGASVALLNGTKYETHFGNKVTIGNAKQSQAKPVVNEKNEKRAEKIFGWFKRFSTLKEDGDRWKQDGSNWKQKITDLNERVKAAKLKASQLKQDFDSCSIKSKYYSAKAAGAITIKASGTLKLVKGDAHLELTGGHAQLKKGGQSIECNGNVTIRGAQAKWE